MTLWQRVLHNPQRIWLRRALFQVHLWVGVVLVLYLVAVGLSGSILVFREELTALTYRDLMYSRNNDAPPAALEQVVANLRAAHPESTLGSVFVPPDGTRNFTAYFSVPRPLMVMADSATGQVVGTVDRTQSWITWLQQLHFNLLLGEAGLLANGIGGLLLFTLCVTGLAIWWPGVRNWVRALGVNFRANWKRINWDLHSAIGFWTLGMVALWAVTGAYFTWPREFAKLVNRFSPVTNAAPPSLRVTPVKNGRRPPTLGQLIAKAEARDPHTKLAGVIFPSRPATPLAILMARGEIGNTRDTNYLYFDPYRGTHLATWERGVNRTAGDTIVFLMGPLHFGVYWGLAVKILWAVIGLSIPLLAVTGVLMYWNRWLGKRWKKLRFHKETASPVSELPGLVR